MSNRRQPRSRGELPPRPIDEPRPWTEVPSLLERICAPVGDDIDTCEHLVDPLTKHGTESCWAPMITERLVCVPCSVDLAAMFAALAEVGHAVHRCDGCWRATRRLMRVSGRIPHLRLNVGGWFCLSCWVGATEGDEQS